MRWGGVFILWFGLGAAWCAPDDVRRVEYPEENFSITVPADWVEAGPETLAKIRDIVHQTIPAAPGLDLVHVLVPPTPAIHVYAAVVTTTKAMPVGMFHSVDQFRDVLERTLRAWFMDIPIKIDQLSYEERRHVIWMSASGALLNGGEIHSLGGVYFTATGSVQAHCVSVSSDWEKDQAVCRKVIESVDVDPKVALPPGPPASPDLPADADYETMVRRVDSGDLNVNFRSMRMACMKSPHCAPRSKAPEMVDLEKAQAGKQYEKVVEICRQMIREGYVNVEAHISCSVAYGSLHEDAKAKFHMDVAMRLMGSIYFSGDGLSRETALEVISNREEYMALTMRGWAYTTPDALASSFDRDGHHYDRYLTKELKSGKEVTVYFNTDAFAEKSRTTH